MKNKKLKNGGPLTFLGRSQNPDYLQKLKDNIPGSYPKKDANTNDWRELKKFDNGDTLVQYGSMYKGLDGKISVKPNYVLRDSKSGKYHPIESRHVDELQKMYNGGPLGSQTAPDTTRVNSKPFIDNASERLQTDTRIEELGKEIKSAGPLTSKRSISKTRPSVREKALGGLTKNEDSLIASFKSLLATNTNDVFKKEYSAGGQLLSTAAGMVPGIGGILSPVVSLIDQQMSNKQMEAPAKPMNMNTNVYGNQMASGGFTTPNGVVTNVAPTNIPGPDTSMSGPMPGSFNDAPSMSEAFNKVGTPAFEGMAANGKRLAHGGMVTNDFKQYNTGSHASGNDLNINAGGAASNNNVTASVQNQENAYTNKTGSTYVHSDVLVNPESGNTFNIDAAKLNKKFSKADKSMEDKNALDFTMNRLSLINDKVRTVAESVQKALGGNTKQMYNGGPNSSVPASDNSMWDANTDQLYEQPDPNMVKTMYDTSNVNIGRTERALPNLDGLVKNRTINMKNRSTVGNSDFNFNIPAMALKSVGLAKSAVDALTPPEVEQPILTDYNKSDQQMYATNIDYTQAKQDALAAANLAGNVNRSASGSFEQYQGRQANNYANLADNLGRTSMREALDRNQQYVQRAGYEQGKAVDKTNRLTQNRINNQMNAANADLADQKLFSEITDVGSQFNKYQNYREMVTNKKEIAQATINEGIALLGSKYTNFGFSDDFMERIKSGTATIDEMVKFIATTENLKKESKTTETKDGVTTTTTTKTNG